MHSFCKVIGYIVEVIDKINFLDIILNLTRNISSQIHFSIDNPTSHDLPATYHKLIVLRLPTITTKDTEFDAATHIN